MAFAQPFITSVNDGAGCPLLIKSDTLILSRAGRALRCKLSVGDCTMAAAILVAIFVATFIAIFLPIMSGKHWRAAQDRARTRRIADARMNARLLRLNI